MGVFGKPGRTWFAAVGLLWLVATAAQARQEEAPLQVGLVPSLSARTLISAYQPLREFLAQALRQPVELYTAPDFTTFFHQTQRGDFDLVMTPAHFAWLAIQEAGYVPLVTYRNELGALLIVRHDSTITGPAQLKGKTIGVVDMLAIVTLRGTQWLREQGFKAGRDYTQVTVAPHNTAALAVARGDIDAAIIASGPYRLMPEDIRSQVRVLSELGVLPHAVYLARGDLPAARRHALTEALLAFGNASPEGRRFMEEYRFGGFKRITAGELRAMEAYAREVKRLMQASP